MHVRAEWTGLQMFLKCLFCSFLCAKRKGGQARLILTFSRFAAILSVMPRAPRASVGGICYHVMNRGNGRRAVFQKDGDYQAFLKAIGHACIEIPMPVLGFCLLPNHFHLVVWPKEDGI